MKNLVSLIWSVNQSPEFEKARFFGNATSIHPNFTKLTSEVILQNGLQNTKKVIKIPGGYHVISLLMRILITLFQPPDAVNC